MSLELYIGIVVAGFCLWALVVWWRKQKIARVYSRPLKPEWLHILKQEVGFYARLPDEVQKLLRGHISYFMYSKSFVGCEGLQVDDRMRLTIAANACLLVAKRGRPSYSSFETILIYPDTYVAKQPSRDGMVVHDDESVRAGESWYRGPIVLSWADVVRGTSNLEDGNNVVMHEFAHKLDEENGVMDGLPILRNRSQYAEWSKVLNEEYDSFLHRVAARKNEVIDSYGAVSPVEFFAVITESYFEKPGQMQQRLPELYGQLKRFYDLDPLEWQE